MPETLAALRALFARFGSQALQLPGGSGEEGGCGWDWRASNSGRG